MKVGFIAPQSIAAVNGGVRTQVLMTAKHLEKLGVEIEFVSPWSDLSTSDIDLFHIFVATPETIGIVSNLRERNEKIILSPVLFSTRSASKVKNLLSVEKLLNKISAGVRSEFAVKKEICTKTDLLLPNTSEEAHFIEEAFDITSNKVQVIPNGVEERFKDSDSSLFQESKGLNDFVLFAGHASAPRKNVLQLIKTFQTINSNLVIIGDLSNSKYSLECQELASKNDRVHLYPTLPHDSKLLASAYAACKVFVLPSQYETPGISAMEAALAGANIVITKIGGTKDYFDGFAEFISPDSVQSITEGIKKALVKPESDALKHHILSNFTWNVVAEQTLAQYKKVLF